VAQHLAEVLTGHESGLADVRVWLGSGAEALQAQEWLGRVVMQHLPDCVFSTLPGPGQVLL
jgi:hypothetical protein